MLPTLLGGETRGRFPTGVVKQLLDPEGSGMSMSISSNRSSSWESHPNKAFVEGDPLILIPSSMIVLDFVFEIQVPSVKCANRKVNTIY